MSDRIPISAAEAIGKAHTYDQVIIYARRIGDDGLEWVTTWGKNRAHCDAAARIGDAIGRKVVQPLEERDQQIARLRALLARGMEALEPFSAFAFYSVDEQGWKPSGADAGRIGDAFLSREFDLACAVAHEIEEALSHG